MRVWGKVGSSFLTRTKEPGQNQKARRISFIPGLGEENVSNDQGRIARAEHNGLTGEERSRARGDARDYWITVLARSASELEIELASALRAKAEFESSRPYQLTLQLLHAWHSLAPAGSRRGKLLRVGIRAIRAVPRLRHRPYRQHHLRAVGRLISELPERAFARASFSRAPRKRSDNPGDGAALLPNLPAFETVHASIIIPVFNHFAETLSCLHSITRHTADLSYEVIVVDDASSDETERLLARMPNLVYLRNKKNLGFIGSCNRGAAVARGDFLVFLNNDTTVTDGWLQALAQTFREFPDAGLAGAKLIYPDGRLQEAGGVIWRDASGWNYGRYDDPNHPRYNFAREVDYCSGACVMVPRTLFERLGGFDTRYTPAYYEDTDLAFKIRHAGHKVIYQPRASIVHHEGLTSGTDLDSGTKAYQRVNQVKFRERWRDRLESHPEPPEAPPRLVHPSGIAGHARGQVLVVDHMVPTPDRDAGSLRMFELMRAIRRGGHHVAFFPDNLALNSPYHEQLQAIGIEIIHPPYYYSLSDFLRKHGQDIDLAILSRADHAERHLFTVKRLAPAARIAFDTVDLHYRRQEREAALKNDPELRTAAEMRKEQELRLAWLCDTTIVVSNVEREVLLREDPELTIHIIPTILPMPRNNPPGYEGRNAILFIGSFAHPPNRDAVLYFAREIFPRVRCQIPQARFQIIGPRPPEEILDLAGEAIEVLGYVPDAEPYFDRARLSVAPLRFGAGVKGKVNQSMALGVPTVVSSIAAEGMYLVHGQNSMIADDPAAFAEAVVQVWSSPELWRRLSENGQENLRKHFSVEAASKQVDELLSWAGLDRPRRGAAGREYPRVNAGAGVS